MPKTNRDLLKRHATSAITGMDQALAYLLLIRNVYAGGPYPVEGVAAQPEGMIEPVPGRDHPQYREAIEQIAHIVVQAHDLLQVFRDEVM